mmetsp:Transcript_68750/g.157702  ORF Transcript_68750/g.157702 Transcript_68750/m.157702 type:complete len:258 (-) Transcript_68750:1687-2460(-)
MSARKCFCLYRQSPAVADDNKRRAVRSVFQLRQRRCDCHRPRGILCLKRGQEAGLIPAVQHGIGHPAAQSSNLVIAGGGSRIAHNSRNATQPVQHVQLLLLENLHMLHCRNAGTQRLGLVTVHQNSQPASCGHRCVLVRCSEGLCKWSQHRCVGQRREHHNVVHHKRPACRTLWPRGLHKHQLLEGLGRKMDVVRARLGPMLFRISLRTHYIGCNSPVKSLCGAGHLEHVPLSVLLCFNLAVINTGLKHLLVPHDLL